jgi:hypothetical protein
MTRAELFEDIRALLREPQLNVSDTPWVYDDSELVIQVRAALRRLRNLELTAIEMSSEGVFSEDPTEEEGLLLSYYVAAKLLSGDLVQKLQSGELGLVFRAGTDTIDTKTGAIHLKDAALVYQQEYQMMLTRALTPLNRPSSVFGDQRVPPN